MKHDWIPQPDSESHWNSDDFWFLCNRLKTEEDPEIIMRALNDMQKLIVPSELQEDEEKRTALKMAFFISKSNHAVFFMDNDDPDYIKAEEFRRLHNETVGLTGTAEAKKSLTDDIDLLLRGLIQEKVAWFYDVIRIAGLNFGNDTSIIDRLTEIYKTIDERLPERFYYNEKSQHSRENKGFVVIQKWFSTGELSPDDPMTKEKVSEEFRFIILTAVEENIEAKKNKTMIPLLEEMLNDRNQDIQKRAKAAIDSMGGEQ